MANLGGGMNLPGLFMQSDRLNQQLPPGQYDPANYVDPTAAIQAQQQWAQQIFKMQNPRLALPQQFGQAIGNVLNNRLNPQGASAQQPQGQGPTTPVGQAIEQTRKQLIASGMDPGEALYKAATMVEMNPQFANDPQASQVAEHARDWAIQKGKFDPELERKARVEAKYKNGENLVGPKGDHTMAQPGTELYNLLMENGYQKAGEVGQLTPGTRHMGMAGGLNVEEEAGNDGKFHDIRKSVQPVQYGAQLGGDDARGVWPGGPKTFGNADAAKVTEALTNRSIATKNAIDAVDLLKDTATSMSVGKPGEIAERVNNARSTVSAIATQLGMSSNVDDYKMKWGAKAGAQMDKWRQAGIDAEKVKSLFLATAMLDEATSGDKNATDANRKFAIEQRMKLLGEDSSDPKALEATLNQRRAQYISQLNNEFEGKPNVMSKPPWLTAELNKVGKGDAVSGTGWSRKPSQKALDHLKAHPETSEEFKAYFGRLP